mgnify:CR=1 FL=1
MTDRDNLGDVWVCTDCYFAHHYGAYSRKRPVTDAEALNRAFAEHNSYLAKYGEIMAERDWTPEWFGNRYSVPLAITPTRFRYW